MPKSSGSKVPRSNLEVEIILRSGALEIRAKGTISELAKHIPAVSDFANWASSKISKAGAPIDESPALEELSTDIEPPVIKVSKKTSDNVRSLFSTPWGRTPKGLDEVTRALEVNAVPASAPTIAMALTGLVRRGDLRRVKKGGKWVYYHIPS